MMAALSGYAHADVSVGRSRLTFAPTPQKEAESKVVRMDQVSDLTTAAQGAADASTSLRSVSSAKGGNNANPVYTCNFLASADFTVA